MFSGKLFPPRGLVGLTNLIKNELKGVKLCVVKGSANMEIEALNSLAKLPKLRVPQSIWIPLVHIENCSTVASFESAVKSIDFAAIPPLESVGVRVSQSREIPAIGSLSQLQSIAMRMIPKDLHRNEFSIHLNHKHQLSIQTNVIPPRPWIPTPQELSNGQQPKWWSVSDTPSPSREQVSDAAIREFRNESSLACLSAALVLSSNLGHSLQRKHLGEETIIWDPFVGNGSVLLEVVANLSNSPFLNRRVTIVANVASKETGLLVVNRLSKLANSISVDLLPIPQENENSGKPFSSGGRKSRRSTVPVEMPESDDTPSIERMQSFQMQLPNETKLTIHLAHAPFQEVFPFISGALILTHIPKGYSEMLGIDKRTLSDWTSFGNLIKTNRKFEIFVLAESATFFKYTKLKFFKMIHLVSPNGSGIGTISKWVGI